MLYEFFISFRYLKAKRKQAFISLISLISVGGVMVGVAALIIVLAVMTGFENQIRDKILGLMAHIIVEPREASLSEYQDALQTIQHLPQVHSVSPYVSAQLLVSAGENVSGITLKGINPKISGAFMSLEKHMLTGNVAMLNTQYENVENPEGPKRDGIIIGSELARILGVFSGDEVSLILPMGYILPTGPMPKLKKLRVIGIFNSGYYEYDMGLAYISLTSAQKFLNLGSDISGLEVRLTNLHQSQQVLHTIKARLGSQYQIRDWTELNKSLFSAIGLEKLAMFLILALIVLVAAFNISSTLVMMVMEKHSDIAILKSMGATSSSIMKIFMMEGLIIGIIGTILGTVLGVSICWLADTFKLISIPGGSYHITYLPFDIAVPDVLFVILSVLLICFASALYPARQASGLDPITILRYE